LLSDYTYTASETGHLAERDDSNKLKVILCDVNECLVYCESSAPCT